MVDREFKSVVKRTLRRVMWHDQARYPSFTLHVSAREPFVIPPHDGRRLGPALRPIPKDHPQRDKKKAGRWVWVILE